MPRKTIDKAAVRRASDKLATLAFENERNAQTDTANRDYFLGKKDAYTAAAYRLMFLLDNDGKDV